jgi:hypothetical protein
MLESICKYIQSNDRNSDIMDAFKEYQNGELPYEALVNILKMVLSDWKEDIEYSGMTKREAEYYKWLGIL